MTINARTMDFNNENLFPREHVDYSKLNPKDELWTSLEMQKTTLQEDIASAVETFKEIKQK